MCDSKVGVRAAMSRAAFRKFRDEKSALVFVQRRLWPHGPVCPHCGASDHIGDLRGQTTQLGSYKCYHCRKVFTVKTATFFESSHVPLHKWLQAIYLCGCEQIRPSYMGDVLGVSFKTAAFMVDRIRYAAANRGFNDLINSSLIPEDAPNDKRASDDDAEAGFFDRAGEQTASKSDEAQFDRFLSAVSQFRQDNLADKFATTFGRIVKARLKLRAWRKDLERRGGRANLWLR